MSDHRVLIVDDQRSSRRMLRDWLDLLGLGFDVLDVPSGEEALLELPRHPVGLLITAARLPGLAGAELARRVRARYPETCIVFLLHQDDPALERKAAQMGAAVCLRKPLERDQFLAVVRTCLGLEPDSGKPSTPASQPAAGPPAEHSLASSLAGLRQGVGAGAVILVDDRGKFLAQAGDLPDGMAPGDLVSAIMPVFSAGQKVSHLLAMPSPRNVLSFAGAEVDLHVASVGPAAALVLLMPALPGEWAAVIQAVHPVLDYLAVVLSGMGMSMLPQPELEEVIPPLQAPKAEPVVEDLQGLEALFAEKPVAVAALDVDAFWAEAAESGQGSGSFDQSALSYEQAAKLGLTPDKGE